MITQESVESQLKFVLWNASFFPCLVLKIYFSRLSWLKFSKWKLNGEHGAQYVFTIAVFTEQIDPFLQLEIRVQRDSKCQETYKVKALAKMQGFFFILSNLMTFFIFPTSFLFYIFSNSLISKLKIHWDMYRDLSDVILNID